MGDKKVTLVTGAAGYWGAEVAAELHSNTARHVIGLARTSDSIKDGSLDIVQVDLNNSLLPEFLRSESVDTICHLQFEDPAQSDSTGTSSNAAETAKVLEAAEKAGVERVILVSSTSVYGAHPDNPAILREGSSLRGDDKSSYTRGYLVVESLASKMREKGSRPSITVLRFANIIGPKTAAPFSRYLSQPSPAVFLGFDPMFQVIHEQDAVKAVVVAAENNVSGEFNIAAEGAVPLSRIFKIIRKFPTPRLHAFAARKSIKHPKFGCGVYGETVIPWDYLRYSIVADLTKMKDELGFEPSISPVETLLDLCGRKPLKASDETESSEAEDVNQLRELMRSRAEAREKQPD